MPKKYISGFLVMVFLAVIVLTQLPTSIQAVNAPDNAPWLGVGLGFNTYTKADVDNLGKPWVFNWGMGDTFMENHTAHNRPDLDFPDRYVPSIYGCDVGEFNSFKAKIEAAQYSGPILVLNEPDNGDQTYSGCTYRPPLTNGPTDPGVTLATGAVAQVARVIEWRDQYATTGAEIDVIIGGTFASPNAAWDSYNNAYGGFWFDKFQEAWEAEKNTVWPDVEGIHFHLYTYANPSSAQGFIDFLKNNIIAQGGWEDWLEAHPYAKGTKERIWVTEIGILHDNQSRATVGTIMDAMLPFLKSVDWIDRVAWFTHSTSTHFYATRDQTMLVDGMSGSKTSLWTKFKNWCLNQLYCLEGNDDYYLVFMNNWGNYPDWTAPPQFLYYPKYKVDLKANDQAPGTSIDKKIVIISQPEHGQVFSTLESNEQVIYYVPNHLYKGYDHFQYQISFAGVEPMTLDVYIAVMDFWLDYPAYLSNHTIPSYLQPGFLAPPAPQLAKEPVSAPSGTYAANPSITVKDSSITGNLVRNSKTANFDCTVGYWCRWQRNAQSSYLIEDNGSLSITAPVTTGDYGSCWIQWLLNSEADGSTYRIKARYLSNFPTNKSFMQIQTLSNENYLTNPWLYTTGNTSVDTQVAISDPQGGPFAVKFCSWGTGLSLPGRAVLEKVSVSKM